LKKNFAVCKKKAKQKNDDRDYDVDDDDDGVQGKVKKVQG
jgi:hypothetical protein